MTSHKLSRQKFLTKFLFRLVDILGFQKSSYFLLDVLSKMGSLSSRKHLINILYDNGVISAGVWVFLGNLE